MRYRLDSTEDLVVRRGRPAIYPAPRFKVEKGISLPNTHIHTFPFSQMKRGDSFLIPEGKRMNSLRGEAQRFARNNRYKIVTRTVDNGVRVWLVNNPSLSPL